MKFISYKYTYGLNNPYVNIGDYVQTLAVQNALSRIGYNNIDYHYHDRDGLYYFSRKDDQYICIMQGWFSETRTWVPSESITPIYVGTHFNHSTRNFIASCPKLRDHLSGYVIGARDPSTAAFLKDQGLNSYFSRCLTLTFPKRESVPSVGKCFIVDVPEYFMPYIPLSIRKDAQIIQQREVGRGTSDQYHQDKYFSAAQDFLERYKTEATLVITSALHCALPCIAMGIPTILISADKYTPDFQQRLDVVADIIPIYGLYDLREGAVNWAPIAPDIEDLKEMMLENLRLMLDKACGRTTDEQRIQALRKKISAPRNVFVLKEPPKLKHRAFLLRMLIARAFFYFGRKIHG